MKYAVVITKAAETDLLGIGDYIAFSLKEPETAFALVERIQAEIMKLADYPKRCKEVSEHEFKVQGYRKLFVENYIVFFTLSETEKTVFIERVLYNKRNWTEII